ncbi:MAG TPA: hypothetical protein VGD30_12470, partial [Telluria sp.]
MSPDVHGDTISAELQQSCAQEPIHLLGTVQSYGFLMVVDLASRCIIQVSTGVVRHWPGLDGASALLSAPLSRWVDGVEGDDAVDLASLPASHSMVLPWRLRFEQASAMPAPAPARWECLGHRCGQLALLEWLPMDGSLDELHRQSQACVDLAEVVARWRHADDLDSFFVECAQTVQEFSGFDRVMIYRFLPDGCGEIV